MPGFLVVLIPNGRRFAAPDPSSGGGGLPGGIGPAAPALLLSTETNNPLCAPEVLLALGLRGDRTVPPGRVGGPSLVALRRICGRAPPGLEVEVDPLPLVAVMLGVVAVNDRIDDASPPAPARPSRRDFSCFAWRDRKCDRSSDHLISSRPILDLVIFERTLS